MFASPRPWIALHAYWASFTHTHPPPPPPHPLASLSSPSALSALVLASRGTLPASRGCVAFLSERASCDSGVWRVSVHDFGGELTVSHAALLHARRVFPGLLVAVEPTLSTQPGAGPRGFDQAWEANFREAASRSTSEGPRAPSCLATVEIHRDTSAGRQARHGRSSRDARDLDAAGAWRLGRRAAARARGVFPGVGPSESALP